MARGNAHEQNELPTTASRVSPWLRRLVFLMDEAITIPGTSIRIGWDAILGFFVPVAGDAIAALSHISLLVTAFRSRVPNIVLTRMVLNAALDLLTGLVPVLGDLFDAAFKANRKNLELLERATSPTRPVTPTDYVVVATAIAAVLLLVLLPFLLTATLITWLVTLL